MPAKINALAVSRRTHELRGRSDYLGYTEAQLRGLATQQLAAEWLAQQDEREQRAGDTGRSFA